MCVVKGGRDVDRSLYPDGLCFVALFESFRFESERIPVYSPSESRSPRFRSRETVVFTEFSSRSLFNVIERICSRRTKREGKSGDVTDVV